MPVCLRPDKTFKFSLKGDEQIPAKDRPHFIGKYFTSEQDIDIRDRLGKIDRTDAKKSNEQIDSVLKEIVAGVVGMGELDSLEKLLPRLSRGEKWEIAYGILGENQMKEDDVKN